MMAMLVLGGLNAAAWASMSTVVVGDQMKIGGYSDRNLAGPFTAKAAGTSTFDPFQTFCAELEETINPDNRTVYTVEGVGLTNSSDKSISPMTSWLYTNYLSQTGREFSNANNMQYAIWRSMGYSSDEIINELYGEISKKQAKAYENAYTDFSNLYSTSGWSGYGNVCVLTLVTASGKGVQDMLGMTITPVPEPVSILFIGASLGLWYYNRRRLA
jgi:IS1 family transposase